MTTNYEGQMQNQQSITDVMEQVATYAISQVEEAKPLELVRVKLVKDLPMASDKPVLRPSDAVDVMQDLIGDMDRECLMVLNMDSQQKVLNASIIGIGTLGGLATTGKEILRSSVLSSAGSIILMHNHPSGELLTIV